VVSKNFVQSKNLSGSVEDLRSSPILGLKTLEILLSRVEELCSSPLSGLMTLKIPATLDNRKTFFVWPFFPNAERSEELREARFEEEKNSAGILRRGIRIRRHRGADDLRQELEEPLALLVS
jgi:hypothetical protein